MLSEFTITNVRNIQNASLTLGPKFNIFFGPNGAGKTSIIESIYLLATTKSFRSSHSRKIINENNHSLTVFGRIEGLHEHAKLGVEKTLEAKTIRVNGKTVNAVSELAERLPVLVIEQDSHKLVESGPLWRRKFIDWGLFHVKHDFNSVWSSFNKTLKQRNALLLQGADSEMIDNWDEGLATLGERYSELREDYIQTLEPVFNSFAEELIADSDFGLNYKKGWAKDKSLKQSLSENLDRDRLNGRTSSGPHRGDLVIRKNGKDIREHVSRGQEKLLVYALNLAQVSLLKELKDKDTILLLDDLGSELDVNHSNNLLQLLSRSFGQVCITTANLDTIPLANMEDVKLFHVKHGSIEVINELSINND